MKSHAWSFVAVLGITASSLSCVLLVDNSTSYGLTCHFAGESTSACGECIAKNCPTYVNACCGDPICTGNLGSLDTCSGSGTCADLFADTDGGGEDAGLRSSLNDCITTSCASPCANTTATGDDSGPSSTPVVACTNASNKLSCTCTYPSTAASTSSCSATSLNTGSDDVLCCAPDGWVTSGTCTCYVYMCVFDNVLGTCDCGLAGKGDDPDTTYAPGEGCLAPQVTDPDNENSGCCASSDGTHCYCTLNTDTDGESFNCAPSETQVSSCEIASQCPNDLTRRVNCN